MGHKETLFLCEWALDVLHVLLLTQFKWNFETVIKCCK